MLIVRISAMCVRRLFLMELNFARNAELNLILKLFVLIVAFRMVLFLSFVLNVELNRSQEKARKRLLVCKNCKCIKTCNE